MQALARWMGIIILVLGVAVFIVGIMLTMGGATMPGTVMQAVEDEQFPVVTHTGTAQLTVTTKAINTATEITDSAKAIRDARWKASEANPAIGKHTPDLTGATTVEVVLAPGVTVPVSQINLLLGESVLNSAAGALGLGSLVLYIGIAGILAGFALIIAGFTLHKMMAGMAAMGAGLEAMAKGRGPTA